MELWQLEGYLQQISGCTFASMDTRTVPVLQGGMSNPMQGRIEKTTMGTRVMLFTNKGGSAYEAMVRRRLEQAGKDPNSFVLGELPWGARVPNTPWIYHKGEHYLQCIVMKPGECVYYVGGEEIKPENILGLRQDQDYRNQDLPQDTQVIVRAYKLASIFSLRLMGTEITDDSPPAPRPTLVRRRLG